MLIFWKKKSVEVLKCFSSTALKLLALKFLRFDNYNVLAIKGKVMSCATYNDILPPIY